MMAKHQFQVGDIVRLVWGKEPMRVFKIFEKTISTKYLHTEEYPQLCRRADDFVLYQQEEPIMTKLYKTKDDQYGTVLAKDSAGRVVLEMKGSNKVEAFDPKDLTEVVPYTIDINGYGHIEITEGKLKKEDWVIIEGHLYRVCATDTKNPQPKPTPRSIRRIMTEVI